MPSNRAFTPEQRLASFWAKVDKNGPNGCWVWTASRKPNGYAQFYSRGRMHRAHRLAWTLMGRELPAKGLELAHRCHNRICVNPEHIYVATHLENIQDGVRAARHAHGERMSTAKLTEANVLEIRSLRGKELSKSIAARFGVQASHISNIWTRRLWKHLP